MNGKSTESLIIFKRPFMLSAFDAPQPPGTYRVVVDEEQIGGLSFIAYHRIATMLHVPAIGVSSARQQVFVIDPTELAAAISVDAGAQPEDEATQGVRI